MFELIQQIGDLAGQALRPPKDRTWAPRGARPVVRARGRENGRVNIAGVVCFRPSSFLLQAAHLARAQERAEDVRLARVAAIYPPCPLVWCWDNLNVHLTKELVAFAKAHAEWLRNFHMPSYTTELNAVEACGHASNAPSPASPQRPQETRLHRQTQAEEDPVQTVPDGHTGTGLIIAPW
ncbi:transposase [Streptomyces sp. A5-4]|uniref:transposase n=1 Tax=Streptomyces sp. A5-4 TaxID=3384771 RepID=UPI003DA9C1D8